MSEIEIWIILFISLGLLDWILLGVLWDRIRDFFHTKYSFFDITFVIIYFSEQLLLIIISAFFPQYIRFWLGLFALIVVTTASIQKLLMDSRDRKISELNEQLKSLNGDLFDSLDLLKDENDKLRDHNNRLIEYIEEELDKKS